MGDAVRLCSRAVQVPAHDPSHRPIRKAYWRPTVRRLADGRVRLDLFRHAAPDPPAGWAVVTATRQVVVQSDDLVDVCRTTYGVGRLRLVSGRLYWEQAAAAADLQALLGDEPAADSNSLLGDADRV